MKISTASFFGLVLFAALFANVQNYAQTSHDATTLKGTIYDPQGRTVSGPSVTVTKPATSVSRTVTSAPDGTHHVPALPPGIYDVAVEALVMKATHFG